MRDEVATNLNLWEGWTDIHLGSALYDVEGFVADPSSRPFDWVTREVVGDVAGKRFLHMQSHIGIDTIRFALAGAIDVTGVDYSPKAVAAAESIAARVGAKARFVIADVTDLPDSVPLASYDVVFTSYGTIMWFPDLKRWGEMIASRLAPGGVFHIIDVHPFLTVFDDIALEPPLRVLYPYFTRDPLHFEEHGSYADRGAVLPGEHAAKIGRPRLEHRGEIEERVYLVGSKVVAGDQVAGRRRRRRQLRRLGRFDGMRSHGVQFLLRSSCRQTPDE